MKKGTFIPILSALALLASCSQNDIVESTQSSNAISFGTSIGSTGRVASTTAESILDFKVFGVNTGDITWTNASEKSNNFMPGDVVSRTGSDTPWSYSPIKYWPETGNVTFYAYSPQDAVITPTFNEEGNPTFEYEVNTDPTLQKDLLAAIRVDQNKSVGNVSFAFNHLLSKIGFTAQLRDELKDGATLSITDFTITYDDLVKGGTYTYASIDQGQGSWGETSTYAEHTSSTNFAKDAIEVTTNAGSLIGEEDLMLMPQATPTFQVKIEYKVEYTDGMEVDESKTITLPAYESGWEAGKQYVYNFKLSPTEVVFDDVTVGGWEDKETIDWEENDIVITNDKGQRVNAFNASFDNTSGGSSTFTIEGATSVELKSALTHFNCTFGGNEVTARSTEEVGKELVFTPKSQNEGVEIIENAEITITGANGQKYTYPVKLTQAAGEVSISSDKVLYFKAANGAFADNVAGAATSNTITVNGTDYASVRIDNDAFKCTVNGNKLIFTKEGGNNGEEAIETTATITAEGQEFIINLIQPAMPAFSGVTGNDITVKFGPTGTKYFGNDSYTLVSEDITVSHNSDNFNVAKSDATVTISTVKTLEKVAPVTEDKTITLTNVCGDKTTYTVHFTQNGQAYISDSENGSKEVTSVKITYAVLGDTRTLYVINGTIANTEALNAQNFNAGGAEWKNNAIVITRKASQMNFRGTLDPTITNAYGGTTAAPRITCSNN